MDQFGTAQKIIIVDDNVSLADVYKTRLELLGYTVLVAYDGIDALSMIRREQPNLVLLDLMVPKIAGDQILEIMRHSDWGKHIKVMIISNLDEADATPGLRDMGIEAYAVKANLSNDQLDQLVDSILKPANQTEDVNSLETAEVPTVTAVPTEPTPTTGQPFESNTPQSLPVEPPSEPTEPPPQPY